jgi:O-antigen ligase
MELSSKQFHKKIIEILLVLLPIALLFSNIVSEIIILILIVFYFLNQNLKNFFNNFTDPIILLFFIFWFYIILNCFINFDKDPSFSRAFFFIRFPLYILAISFFINKLNINLKTVFNWWLIIINIICVDLFFQFFTFNNILGYEAILQGKIYRLGGFMDDELKISNLIFNLGTLVFSYFFSKEYLNNKKINYFILSFLFLLVCTIFITAERANFVSIVFFSILFSILILIENRKLFFQIIIIFSILISSTTIINDSLSKRMINDLLTKINLFKVEDNKNYLNKNSHYFSHYSAAYQIFQRNVMFGVGLKNFRNFCDDDSLNNQIDPDFHNKKCATHPHSFYFEILSEIGLVGFFLLLSLFLTLFYKIFLAYLKTKDHFLILNSFIIFVYFVPFLPRGSFFTNWNAMIFWTIVGILYSNYSKLKMR